MGGGVGKGRKCNKDKKRKLKGGFCCWEREREGGREEEKRKSDSEDGGLGPWSPPPPLGRQIW